MEWESLEEFIPSRSIRQGDPISPYLFVLCLERLSQIISLAVNNNFWDLIQLGRGEPKISHLCFADDLLLFAEVSLENVEIVSTYLDLFWESSSQRINKNKSRVSYSNNVNWNVICQVSEALGFQRTYDFGKYLGITLDHSHVSRRTYQFALDKTNMRLNSCKVRTFVFYG